MKLEWLLCLLIPSTALAYFDLGTGSYIFQIVLASFFGMVYTTRAYITACFRKFFGKSSDKKEEESTEQNE